MESEEILASITWHYMATDGPLNGAQLQEHKQRGACAACEDATPLNLPAAASVAGTIRQGTSAP